MFSLDAQDEPAAKDAYALPAFPAALIGADYFHITPKVI